MIKIWAPRWHDRKVLISRYKVKEGINEIQFTKTKLFEGEIFRLTDKQIKKYPLESNGTIKCYAVPLDVVTERGNEYE